MSKRWLSASAIALVVMLARSGDVAAENGDDAQPELASVSPAVVLYIDPGFADRRSGLRYGERQEQQRQPNWRKPEWNTPGWRPDWRTGNGYSRPRYSGPRYAPRGYDDRRAWISRWNTPSWNSNRRDVRPDPSMAPYSYTTPYPFTAYGDRNFYRYGYAPRHYDGFYAGRGLSKDWLSKQRQAEPRPQWRADRSQGWHTF